MRPTEYFEVYDASGRKTGLAPREQCHGDPRLIHRTAHVVIRHPDGSLLLQKRSAAKDIQPGKWDTAAGGHLMPGENYEQAARREMAEELGIPSDLPLRVLFDAAIRNEIESEDVMVFGTVYAGPFTCQKDEIDEVRFWRRDELLDPCSKAIFTPNLSAELDRLFQLREI